MVISMTKRPYSIQLYSLRDTTPQDLDGTLAKVSALGYKAVEFAGFFGHTPEQICDMLTRHNLAVSGTHSPFIDLVNHYEETVAYHKAIGNKFYIIPGVDLSSQAKIDAFISAANPLCDKLQEEGITLCYHNHSGEFKPNADGSVPYEQLLYRSKISLEVDTFWAYVGMKDPIALLERVGDRLTFIHIKDGLANGKGFPLGMGEAPVKEVYDWAVAHNIPLVVESETLSPDGITEAKICIEYLATLE